jgi:hypothetical protein
MGTNWTAMGSAWKIAVPVIGLGEQATRLGTSPVELIVLNQVRVDQFSVDATKEPEPEVVVAIAAVSLVTLKNIGNRAGWLLSHLLRTAVSLSSLLLLVGTNLEWGASL